MTHVGVAFCVSYDMFQHVTRWIDMILDYPKGFMA